MPSLFIIQLNFYILNKSIVYVCHDYGWIILHITMVYQSLFALKVVWPNGIIPKKYGQSRKKVEHACYRPFVVNKLLEFWAKKSAKFYGNFGTDTRLPLSSITQAAILENKLTICLFVYCTLCSMEKYISTHVRVGLDFYHRFREEVGYFNHIWWLLLLSDRIMRLRWRADWWWLYFWALLQVCFRCDGH